VYGDFSFSQGTGRGDQEAGLGIQEWRSLSGRHRVTNPTLHGIDRLQSGRERDKRLHGRRALRHGEKERKRTTSGPKEATKGGEADPPRTLRREQSQGLSACIFEAAGAPDNREATFGVCPWLRKWGDRKEYPAN